MSTLAPSILPVPRLEVRRLAEACAAGADPRGDPAHQSRHRHARVTEEAVPELPEPVLRSLLPGAYTLVLPNPGRRFPWLAGDTLGVRVPELPAETALILEAAGPVLATSANLHGGADPRRLEDVPQRIREGCGAVVDGGELPGTPSTVLDLTGEEPRVLREGAVPATSARRKAEAAMRAGRT